MHIINSLNYVHHYNLWHTLCIVYTDTLTVGIILTFGRKHMKEQRELRSLGYSAFEKEYSLSSGKAFTRIRKTLQEPKKPDRLTMEDIVKKYDVKHISPFEMVIMSKELYNNKLISEIEFIYLSFQPETHPRYNETIGKQTGQMAEPSRKRDFLQYWEDKVHQEIRIDSMNLDKSWRVMKILHHLNKLREEIFGQTLNVNAAK